MLQTAPARGLRARPRLSGLVGLRPDAATQAVVIVALGSTSFDGLSRTRFWGRGGSRRALALFPDREATRSQCPLLAAMVLFTVGGLALLLGA